MLLVCLPSVIKKNIYSVTLLGHSIFHMHGWWSQVARLFYWVLLVNTKWCDRLIVYMYHFVKKDHLLWFIAVVNKWMLEESGWPWFILGKKPNHVMHSHLWQLKLRLTIISICTFHVDDCWIWSLKRIPDQLSLPCGTDGWSEQLRLVTFSCVPIYA